MNTGIQDALQPGLEAGADGVGQGVRELLDSYDAERRPVGEEVVGRTVRHARAGIERRLRTTRPP